MYCSIHCKSFPLFVATETQCLNLHGGKNVQSQYCSHVTVLLILLCATRRGETSTRTNNRHFVSKAQIDLSPQSSSVNFIRGLEL